MNTATINTVVAEELASLTFKKWINPNGKETRHYLSDAGIAYGYLVSRYNTGAISGAVEITGKGANTAHVSNATARKSVGQKAWIKEVNGDFSVVTDYGTTPSEETTELILSHFAEVGSN